MAATSQRSVSFAAHDADINVETETNSISSSGSTSNNSLAVRSTNWAVSPKFEQNIYWFFEGLEIELRWSHDRSSAHPEAIYIQQAPMANLEQAREYVAHIIANARCIRKLNLNIQVSTNTIVDALLETLIGRDTVRLEELLVRRRYVGQKVPALSRLIRANSATLRVVGKIGLGEAIESFTGQVHLDRLSLFNFDLVGKDGELDSEELALQTRFFIRRMGGLGRLGLSFDHLSYSAFSGFEITRHPVLQMLRDCKVKSLRLTMQTGVAVGSPAVVAPLLPLLRRLELVGSLQVTSNEMSKLFPALEHFVFQEQDLVTGLIQRARVLSQLVPDYVREANAAPVAAAC